MINVCLIGCGRIGQVHAKYIHNSLYAKLYCVVDPVETNAKIIAHDYSSILYPSLEKALADRNIDAFVICSNTTSHTDIILAVSKLKKPIFCEKPIDLTIKKIDECLNAIYSNDAPLYVGFNRRFDPTFVALRDRVADGVIGTVETLSITSRESYYPEYDYLKNSGGLFKDLSIHDFDLARWILQEEPTEIYVAGSCLIDPKIRKLDDVDTAMMTLKTASGAICQINNSRRTNYGYDQRVEVFGSSGMLKAQNRSPISIELSSNLGIRNDCPYMNFQERYSTAYRLQIEHFLRNIVQEGKEPSIDGYDGRQALVIAEAAMTSLKKGQAVSIPAPIKRKRGLLEAIFS